MTNQCEQTISDKSVNVGSQSVISHNQYEQPISDKSVNVSNQSVMSQYEQPISYVTM